MSQSNGVIRIGKKGLKKFAFGEEGTPGSEPFEVDVVVALQEWLCIDESFRPIEENESGERPVPRAEMPAYHHATVMFAERMRNTKLDEHGKLPEGWEPITVAEALDFLARLREAYYACASFFQPKLQEKPDSPDTSEVELRYSVEGETANKN